MRFLVVEPGPHFSVADVCNGWIRALASEGHEVVRLNLADRLTFYDSAHFHRDDECYKALTADEAIRLAAKGIQAVAMEFWPDVVLIVSGFYIPPHLYRVLRGRGITVVSLLTESPYEDEKQLERADWSDLILLNDPTNLDQFRARNPNSHYMPHAYDPAIHSPGPGKPELASDFCFVGTGYPGRLEFLEAVDWTGIDVTLAGNWQAVQDDSPLLAFLAHERGDCVDNADAVQLYRSTKASANIYRTEAIAEADRHGWAMGPREVELAATRTFFLTEPRGENREVLPMVPTFDTPEDFEKQLRWFLDHEDERREIARAACEAVQDRTFTANVRTLLNLL